MEYSSETRIKPGRNDTTEKSAYVKTFTRSETAKILGLKDLTLNDKRMRTRLGLPAVKVGGRIVFLASDVERVLRRGREKLPKGGAQEV